MVSLCHRVHIKQNHPLGLTPNELDELFLIRRAITHRALFANRIRAMRRRNQRGPIPRDQPSLYRTSSLGKLRRQHAVNIARHGHERHDRIAPGRGCRGLRKELEIVDGSAGTLSHTRHRRRLREIALGLGYSNQPIGQYAATLSTQGCDCQLDRSLRGHIAIACARCVAAGNR